MIIIHINGIDKGFDDMAAEERIVPVAFCKPVKEEQNAVTVEELGL